jgi:hypothetical protein
MIGSDEQHVRLSLLLVVKYIKKIIPFFVQKYCTENRNSNQFSIITDTPDGGKWACNRTEIEIVTPDSTSPVCYRLTISCLQTHH